MLTGDGGADPNDRRLPEMTRAASDETVTGQPLPATTETDTSRHEQ